MRNRISASLIACAVTLSLTAAPSFADETTVTQKNPNLGKQKRSGPIKWPDCYCTDRYGKRHEMGDMICMTVGGRSFEAICGMSQNSPIWRDQNRDCVVGQAPVQTPFPTLLAFMQ